ncbi:MAG TPA: 16S rRNA (cytidine(1402)-2'-O)-methyltransferase [Rhizomicrobium sp.]|jgi:16S rRNA (cytidine1402-2'-O)-methyltransferase|nr:16S rRNA (cytidine(1402)-2'-O)-methyltransferase [Rhizomicrobium sp.]
MRKPRPARPESQSPLQPGLFVTATPVGNARDIGLRALDVLQACDAILAEDTRTTAKLLAIHGISRPLISYNDHNALRVRPQLLKRLERGDRLALVSDAGTPLISDPGYKLVREAIASGLQIHVVPGASAAIAALVVSGLPTNRFLFVGFLPPTQDARRRALEGLKALPCTLIFFEAPQRLKQCLQDMHGVFHERDAVVARELTKLHEDVRRGNLQSLADFYEKNPPRGEVTIVIGPSKTEEPDFTKADELLRRATAFMPLRAAVDLVSEALNLRRKALYARALRQRQIQGGT